MVSIDTNVLVRFLLNDDAEQAMRSRWLIESRQVRLLMTVVLEAAWVLRSGSNLTYREIAAKLRDFADLPSVEVEDSARFLRAMEMVDVGMDFADALHLSAVEPGQAFSTFDQKLIRIANLHGYATVSAP